MKKSKQLVSTTLGPAAKTDSVMHSKTMAMVMNTLHSVPPNVAHDPETVQCLMTLIMVRDLTSWKALGDPGTPSKFHLDFLVENSWHGGMWRSPYSMDSVGVYCIVMYYVKKYLLPLLALVGAIGFFLIW